MEIECLGGIHIKVHQGLSEDISTINSIQLGILYFTVTVGVYFQFSHEVLDMILKARPLPKDQKTYDKIIKYIKLYV